MQYVRFRPRLLSDDSRRGTTAGMNREIVIDSQEIVHEEEKEEGILEKGLVSRTMKIVLQKNRRDISYQLGIDICCTQSQTRDNEK